ncbi:hypothetical protein QJS04_geneDACA024159 [Acorus gramineus]|uniref:Uncharacterized protein n=1 Tax=Acorus gramineus TaxID=55184 RepID=A0AAV9A057_ACOGR|nr:hypothetical protein QJS04_geneDACA024159 [Acorus gramineus]
MKQIQYCSPKIQLMPATVDWITSPSRRIDLRKAPVLVRAASAAGAGRRPLQRPVTLCIRLKEAPGRIGLHQQLVVDIVALRDCAIARALRGDCLS